MKRYIIILFAMAGIFQNISAQNYKLSLQAGYGTYGLSALKDYQQQMVSYYSPLAIKSVDQFPGYINYSLSAEMQLIPQNWMGINYAYFFTGGRNYMKDYSGEYSLTMPVKAHRFGFHYKYILDDKKKIKPFVMIKEGLVFSNFKTTEYVAINDIDTVSQTFTDNSTTFFLEPSVGLSYSLTKNIAIDTNVGWELDVNTRNSYVFWSGLRFLFGIAYEF